MPQKISRKGFAKVYDPVCFAVVEAFAASKLSKSDEAKVIGNPKEDEFFTVSFKVNGVELDFETVMKTFNDQHSRMVNERAAELVQDQFQETLDSLGKMTEGLSRAVKKDVEAKLGIKIHEDDWAETGEIRCLGCVRFIAKSAKELAISSLMQ